MRMTEQEIIELLQAYKPGDVVECTVFNYSDSSWVVANDPPDWNFGRLRYRLKELTPDQRKLKEAEAKVKELEQEIVQLKERVAELENGGWIPFSSGDMPVDEYTNVQLKLTVGCITTIAPAYYWEWDAGDIVAYRVVKEEV